jgi:hypothetical protein
MNDPIPGAIVVEKDVNRNLYAVSFIPADFGRGALARIEMSHEQLTQFFDDIAIRETYQQQALRDLDSTNACHLHDVSPSRAYLQRRKLID